MKVTGYSNQRDYKFKTNGFEINSVEELLRKLAENRYYKLVGTETQEVNAEDEFDILYRTAFEGYGDEKITYLDIDEADDDDLRIIGVDVLEAVPQRTGKVIFDSILVPELAEVRTKNMYPMTVKEFVTTLRDNPDRLNWSDFDFVAIKNH